MTTVRYRGVDRRRTSATFQFQRPDSQVLKARIDPAQFYAAELNAPIPTGTGWAVIRVLCPFHNDRLPGSFTMHASSGAFKCHSCGAAGSDIIAFVMQRDGLSFPEALRHIQRCW